MMNRKVLDEAIEVHGEELVNVINQELEGNKNGQSLLTQQQVENMLNEHFQKVEKLLESNQDNKQSFPDFLGDMREQLKEMLENFKDALIQKVQESKNNLTNSVIDKVEHVKDSARNEIRSAVTDFTEQTKEMAQQLEDRFNQKDKGQQQTLSSNENQPSQQNMKKKSMINSFIYKNKNDKEVLDDLGITDSELLNDTEYKVTVQDIYDTSKTDEITIGVFQDDENSNKYNTFIASENHGISTLDHLTKFKEYQDGLLKPQVQQQKSGKTIQATINSKQTDQELKTENNDLKEEIKELRKENKSLSDENKGLQKKVDKVQGFFKEDLEARKSLNNFLSKDNAPKQEQQEEKSQGMGLA